MSLMVGGRSITLFVPLVVRSGDYRLYDIVKFLLVEPLALRLDYIIIAWELY